MPWPTVEPGTTLVLSNALSTDQHLKKEEIEFQFKAIIGKKKVVSEAEIKNQAAERDKLSQKVEIASNRGA